MLIFLRDLCDRHEGLTVNRHSRGNEVSDLQRRDLRASETISGRADKYAAVGNQPDSSACIFLRGQDDRFEIGVVVSSGDRRSEERCVGNLAGILRNCSEIDRIA